MQGTLAPSRDHVALEAGAEAFFILIEYYLNSRGADASDRSRLIMIMG